MSISLDDRLKELISNDPKVQKDCIVAVKETITSKRKLIPLVFNHPTFIKRCFKLINNIELTDNIILIIEFMLMSYVENNTYKLNVNAINSYFENGCIRPYLNLLSYTKQRSRIMVWNLINQLSLQDKFKQELIKSNIMDSFISYLNALLKNKLLFDYKSENEYMELDVPCTVLLNLFANEAEIQKHKPDDIHKTLICIGKLMTYKHTNTDSKSDALQKNFLQVLHDIIISYATQLKKESVELICKSLCKQVQDNYLPFNNSFAIQSIALNCVYNSFELCKKQAKEYIDLQPYVDELEKHQPIIQELKTLHDSLNKKVL